MRLSGSIFDAKQHVVLQPDIIQGDEEYEEVFIGLSNGLSPQEVAQKILALRVTLAQTLSFQHNHSASLKLLKELNDIVEKRPKI